MKGFAKVTFLLSAVVCFIFCLAACGEKEPLYIGAIVSTESASGPAVEGVELLKGLTMAVDEINGKGGINGRMLEIVHENPALDAQAAVEIFDRMEEEVAPLFYISSLSYMSAALAPHAEEAGVVMTALVATAPEVTENADWVFRLWPTANQEVPGIVSLIEDLGVESLGLVHLNDAYGKSIYQGLAGALALKDIPVEASSFSFDETDFFFQVLELVDNQGIYFLGFPAHLVPIAKAIARQNYRGIVMASNSIAIPTNRHDGSTDGIYTTVPIVYSQSYPFARDFEEAYLAEYGEEPSHFSPCAYDFAKLVADLMKEREVSRMNLKNELNKGFQYSGVFGDIKLLAGDRDISIPLYAAQIRDGEVVYR